MNQQTSRRRRRPTPQRRLACTGLITILTLILSFFPQIIPGAPVPTASAHNLQTRMVSMFMDPASQACLDARIGGTPLPAGCAPLPAGWAPGDPLLQAGDKVGLIIKVVPRDGTTTGVGGHIDFYVPDGVTVEDVAYVVPDGAGGFLKVAMKGQSPIAIGDGSIGAKTTTEMAGIAAVGPNINGVTELPATAGGLHRGTIAGLYGDTGIFYATDPDTAYGSWQQFTGDWNAGGVNRCGSLAFTAANGKTITNNSGDVVVPCNKWDAEQLFAWGAKATTYSTAGWPHIPIVDYGDGRGNAPWGFAAGTAGPESGYAWAFDWDEWLPSAKDKAAVQAAMDNTPNTVGPWKRIQYLGSRLSYDQAGLDSTVIGYTNIDGSSVGYALSPGHPLPADTQAVRWAVGQLTQYRPEYAWVKIKVNDIHDIVDPTGCPIFHSDTFGGDAGGTDNGKDHLWRYYEPTEATWNGCLAAQKPATREIVKVGDTYQYKLKVYNFQDFTLSAVVVRDTLPGGVTFLSAVPAQNSGPNPLVWNVGTLLPGQKWEATVSVTAKSTGFLDNCVEISSGQLPAQTVCDSTTSGGYPYLVPSKTAASSTVTPGGTVTYDLLVKNVGTASSASPVVLNEYLPTGFTYQGLVGQVKVNGASVPQTTVDATNPNQPTFTVPAAIQAGKELKLTFAAVASADITPGAYCNMYRVVDNGIPITTGSEACVTVGGGNGKIGDTVFRDWDGDGAQDAGEEGLPGVTVTLTRPDASTATLTTDANGQYLFASLAAGSYTVSVPAPGTDGVPAGWALTADPDGAPYNLNFTYALGADEAYLGADFGYQPTGSGSIGDQAFDDKDLSGAFNAGDAGIPNVTVRLYEDSNGDGQIDAGDALVATTFTDGGGVYGFTGLAAGFKYVADVDQADPDLSTYFGGGVYTQTTSDPHNVGTLTDAYTAADFGFHKDVPPGTVSIGDTVFIDADNNGTYEAGVDTPLPDVGLILYQDLGTIGVLDAADVAIMPGTSSITGTYTFSELPAGTYLVDVAQDDQDIPSGYALRPGTSDPWPVTLGPSRTDVDFPFVYVPPPPSPLNKAVDKASANAGDALTYSLTTSYTGSSLLTNVTVTDTIPAGTTYVADSDTPEAAVTPADNATATLLTWNLGSNAAGVPGYATGGGGGPREFTAIKDASITSARADSNFGGQTSFSVSPNYHAVLEFDLSSIPTGASIASAELVLDRTGGTLNPTGYVEVRALTESWVEGTQLDAACTDGVTWNSRDCNPSTPWTTAGGTINSTVYATAQIVTGINTLNVTGLVQAWVNGSLANNGLLLQEYAAWTQVHTFSSKEGTTPPELRINLGPKTGILLFSSNANAEPAEYRTWDGSAFASPVDAANLLDRFRNMTGAAGSTRREVIVIGSNASAQIEAELWNSATWTDVSASPNLPSPLGRQTYTYFRGGAVAYEQLSGDAILVWNDNTQAAGSQLRYSVWNGTLWTVPATVTPPFGQTGEPLMIEMAAKPGSDELVMVTSTPTGDWAAVWNGSSWGNEVALYAAAQTEFTDVAVAYEQQSGQAMVVYAQADADTNMYYQTWNGSSWSGESSVAAPAGAGVTSRPDFTVLAADPKSDRLGLGVTTNNTGTWLGVWTGSVWAASQQASASNCLGSTGTNVYPCVAVAFESLSGEALATYTVGTNTNVAYRTLATGSSTWSAAATLGATSLGIPNTKQLYPSPNSNTIMMAVQDDTPELFMMVWDGSSNAWGMATNLGTTADIAKNQPWVFVWDLVASLPALKDAYLANLSAAGNNYGTCPGLGLANTTGSIIRRPLYQFNLSSIPTGCTIDSATMVLYASFIDTQPKTVDVHRVTSDWDEGTVCAAAGTANWTNRRAGPIAWTTPGGDYASPAVTSVTVSSTTAAYYSFDLKTLVQSWVDGTHSNYGVLLNQPTQAGAGEITWQSKNTGTPAYAPKLNVAYTCAASGPSLGNVMAAVPMLVTAGSTITVTQELTSSVSIANVSPNTLVITGTNGVGATLLTGPTPASATIGASPTTFTWTYQATAGTSVGQLTFGGDADDGDSNTWRWAESNSVIAHPPLALQVTVNNPATVNPVTNKGYIKDASVIPLSPSNTVQTTLGASIGDRVWADLDGDGVQDVGEPGISGVEVCATPAGGGGGGGCAITDSQGIYHIYGLTDGAQYTVTMTPATIPTDYQPTTPTTLTRTATLAGVTDADFGLRPPGTASIGDTICLDTAEDGCDAGDAGLPDITVKLYKDLTNNGLTGDDILMDTTTTDAGGVYTFTGLYGGDYLVQVDTGSSVTSPYDGTTTLATAMDLVSGTNPHDVALTDGQAYVDADFGYNWGGSIGDYVWWDNDTEGDQDEAAPIADAAVLLYFDANGNGTLDAIGGDYQVGFDMTDAGGLYLFEDLPPGDYLVDVYEDSITTDGNRNIVPTTYNVHDYTLGSNEDYLDADFGYYHGALVHGSVFHDDNRTALFELSETGLSPVTVNLTGTDMFGNPVSVTTTTDADGHYEFVVREGNYTLTYDTGQTAALGYPDPTTPVSYSFHAYPGENWYEQTYFDFGVDYAGQIGDTVWYDIDGDGVGPDSNGLAPGNDDDEPGLAGVTVSLYRDNNNDNQLDGGDTFLDALVNDANGSYLFVGLADGDYIVVVNPDTLPDNMAATYDNSGVVDGTGQADISGGNADTTVDFGYKYEPLGGASLYTIAGQVYDDANNNSNYDTDPTTEDGFANVEVVVVCDFATFTVKTNSTGAWYVSGIPEGSVCTVLDADESDLPRADYAATEAPGTPITVNDDITGLDFGYNQRPGSISGTVCAGDSDGLCEPGETPLQSVPITLVYSGDDGILGTDDDETFTTSTDANGDYSFTGLEPGVYQIGETNLPNYTSLADADGGNPDNISVNLLLGQNKTDQDFEDARDPAIGVAKRVVGDPVYNGNGTFDVTYEILVQNVSTVALSGVQVTDDLATTYAAAAGFAVIGVSSATFTANPAYNGAGDTNLLTGADSLAGLAEGAITLVVRVIPGGNPGPYSNNAVGRGTPPTGPGISDTSTDGVDTDPDTPGLTTPADNPTPGDNSVPTPVSFDLPASYTVTKTLVTVGDVRITGEVIFSIRIENTGLRPITVLPLQDVYDTEYLIYGFGALYSAPESLDNDDDGTITWPDLTVSFGKDLGLGESFEVIVIFTARADTTDLSPDGKTPDSATVQGALSDNVSLPTQSSEARVQILKPTGIALADFTTAAAGSGVLLRWETLSESRIAGYNLLRQRNGAAGFEPVNAEPIAARHAGQDRGAAYSFRDAGLAHGACAYVLQAIRLDGRVEALGQVEVSR